MPSFASGRPSKSPSSSQHARVIAVVNQKGGVGKTTTAVNVAASLALEGISTLLIDCDPQANATSGLGVPKSEDKPSIYDVLLGEVPARQAIVDTSIPDLALIPGSRNLIGANLELIEYSERERRLHSVVDALRPDYTFILIDCPPALDLLTLNALVAADRLLVPMQAEYFALEGISELMATLDRISASFNPQLGLEGVLLTMFDERMNLAQQVRENLRDFFGDKLYNTTIPRNVRLAEAPSHGQPAVTYDARSRGAEAYRELTVEIMERNGLKQRKRSTATSAQAARTPEPGSATPRR